VSAVAQKATLGPEPDSDVGAVAVLGVLIGNEAYGVPLASVREILIPPPITEVPRAEDHFLGVISVRGEIVTVIDLATLLNLEVVRNESCGRILLVDNGQEIIGVAVDRVLQVYRLGSNQIEYASAMSADLSDYVVGVGRIQKQNAVDADDTLILIDPVSLLGE
jgi:purine-binding chemotaxis protein CheW